MTFVSRSEMRKHYANYIWNRSSRGFTRIPRIVTDNPPRFRTNPRLLPPRYRLRCLGRLEHKVIHSSYGSNQCQCGYMPHQIWPNATLDRALNRTFLPCSSAGSGDMRGSICTFRTLNSIGMAEVKALK